MSKFRITYRLNDAGEIAGAAEKKSDAGTSRAREASALNKFTTDFGAWSSPFDEETRKLEQLIRQTNDQRADRTNPETGFFDRTWSDAPAPPGRRPTPWLKVITAVSGAVVTGLFIGMFILSLFGDKTGFFPGRPTDQTSSGSQQLVQEQAPKDQTAAENSPIAADSENNPTTGWLQVDIPAQTYFMLQNGIFTSEQGAKSAEEQLANGGFAAYIRHDEKYYVFAGAAATREDALALRKRLEDKKLEGYIKLLDLPQISKVEWDGAQAETVDAFFLGARNLIRSISGLTTLYAENQQPVSDAVAAQLESGYQAWSAAAAKLGGTVPRDAEQTYAEINNAVNTAVVAMDKYRKKADAAYLREAQSALLRYILVESDLWGSLKAVS